MVKTSVAMKLLSVFIKVGLTTIFFVLLPVAVFILITMRTTAIPGIRSYVVVTGSMEPTIPVGSIAIIRTVPRYNVGDVIAFNRDNKTIIHRIVDTIQTENGLEYITEGDNNNGKDGTPVRQKDVIGKGLIQITAIGKMLNYLRTLPGFLLVIMLPALVLVIKELFVIKKEIEKQTEKRLRQQWRANGL